MKKFIFSLFMAIFTISTFAQSSNCITTFRGIPICGSFHNMCYGILGKGFEYKDPFSSTDYEFTGEFNGKTVTLGIKANNNKVYRIWVQYMKNIPADQIINEYNTLSRQFTNNGKYVRCNGYYDTYQIPDNENLSYEISMNNKGYQASFYQKTSSGDPCINSSVWFRLSKQDNDKYEIWIYYDNPLNQPDGSDL